MPLTTIVPLLFRVPVKAKRLPLKLMAPPVGTVTTPASVPPLQFIVPLTVRLPLSVPLVNAKLAKAELLEAVTVPDEMVT